MQLDEITVVILTRNEAANLARTLRSLAWARRIVVVDSQSEDGSRAIAMSFPSVILFDRPFDTHAAQWNFAVSQTGIDTSWILALDADYQVTEALASEIKNLQPDKDVSGFRARFVYCEIGRAHV